MKTFEILKAELEEEIKKSYLKPDDDVKSLVRYSVSKRGCGYPQDNQILTTWWYGTSDGGYIADWLYFLVELAKDESYTLQELCKMARFWFLQPSHFAEYAGLVRQYYFTKEIDNIMDSLSREQFVALLSAFRVYIANINVWVFHYLPWGVGYAFMRKEEAYYREALKLCGQSA